MDWTLRFYLLLSVLNLSIGVCVYLKNPRKTTNRVFGLFSATIVLWTLAIGLAYSLHIPSLFVVRSTFAAASLMLLGLLTLFIVFPSSPFPRNPLYLVFAGASLLFAGLALSPLLVRDVSQGTSVVVLSYGDLHRSFGFYVYACLGYCLVVLWKKLRTARGLVRLQLRYLLLGLLLPGVAITITNLLIPLVFTTSRFGRYGPAFSLMFVGLTAHAIIRHRLMNIRLVIRRGVAYLLAVAIAGGVFVAVVSSASTLITPHLLDFPLWLQVVIVLMIALLFQPLKRWIQASLDRYLYREPYNYQQIIRESSRTIGTLLDLQPLLSYVCELVGRTIQPEVVIIYIRRSETFNYERMCMRMFIDDNGQPEPSRALSQNSPLPDSLTRTRTYLLCDDLRRVTHPDATYQAEQELTKMGGEIALPIFHEKQLMGFLVLAPKLSGDPYFTEDIDLLSTLIDQAAIAIKNAQLYRDLALANEYITNIVAAMESGVIAVSPNGNVTLFNPAAERLTGLPRKAAISNPVGLLPVALANPLQATLGDGHPRLQPETTISDSAGRITSVSCSTSALRDRSGTILAAVAVFSDLSQLKELEAERRRGERLAAFSALTSGIAHEIKNPLVAIKTFAELLPERFTEEDFRDDFSKVVIREINRIDDLVARLRGLAAPPTHPLTPLNLRQPIEDTLALLRAQLERKKIRLRRLYDPGLPLVPGDPAQLTQLFLNLLLNAVEAMDLEGELTIRLRAQSRDSQTNLVVTISDTGPGIPEPLLGRIFDPFVTTKSSGSGLGLAISRGIADSHGATIRAGNNPQGNGSIIILEFPTVLEMTPAASA